MEIGAVSLIMNFPSDKLEVLSVYLGDEPNSPVEYAVDGNEIRIGWITLEPLLVVTNDRVLTLKTRSIGSINENETIRFELTYDPLNELANGSYNIIQGAVLKMNEISGKALGTGDITLNGRLTLENNPNPFRDKTTLVYTLPVNGKVSLEIHNLLGSRMTVLLEADQMAGKHTLDFDASTLPVGIYTATLRLSAPGTSISRTIKIVHTH